MVKMATSSSGVSASGGANPSGLATGSEGLVCFVCDIGVVGRYYPLATCRTQTTRVRLIEKLGQLVGDEYMVIISQDDIICRGCATMINSLDRLEKELGSIRSIVLRYLEKKYELEEGELVNARANQPIPTPKSSGQSPIAQANDFQSRKRRAMMASENIPDEVRGTGKDASWLQCDKCKYTTNYGSFMTHHARIHKKKEGGSQGGSGTQQQGDTDGQHMIDGGGDDSMMVDKENGAEGGDRRGDTVIATEMSEEESRADGGETVEMIAAEIGADGFTGAKTADGQMVAMVELENKVTLQAVEGEDGQNTLCMVDENGIIVQKVEQAEDGTLYVHVPDGTDSKQQVLSVAEDGSVQMVEVLWDEMVSPEDADSAGMVTF